MLEKLTLAQYRLSIAAVEPVTLPEFKGSTLRGGFGMTFKQIACASRQGNCPGECEQRDNCAYGYVFETPVPSDAAVLRSLTDIPRPFLIEPPLDRKTDYRAGESMAFGVTLVGKGIEYLPYFVLAFKLLGANGIGKGRGRFTLARVETIHPYDLVSRQIYSGSDDALRTEELTVRFEDIIKESAHLSNIEITIRFLTPTRIKHDKDYVTGPTFHVLMRALLRRISSLYYFHCGEKWEVDYRGLIAQAQAIKLAHAQTRWVEWERYSSRQDRKIALGGFVGEATFVGDLAPFLPLLLLGELVHVGKACVFGNGQYVVVR